MKKKTAAALPTKRRSPVSNDVIGLLSVILQRHGPQETLAALIVACSRQATNSAEEGCFQAEERWKTLAQGLSVLLYLPKPGQND
jgi:hypothetical protein